MCSKQKACEESQGDVVVVKDVGVIVCTAFPYTQKHLWIQQTEGIIIIIIIALSLLFIKPLLSNL